MSDGSIKKAFVLMPFDQEFKPIYSDLIKPALESAGYEVQRADSFIDQRNILRDVVKGISEANLVIADLTAVNPNVFYELGLCNMSTGCSRAFRNSELSWEICGK